MVGSAAGRPRRPYIPILVAALGYFVDIYDLILFSVVRVPSLQALGWRATRCSSRALLINMQMVGMLVGGVLWGVLGDRRGRLSVLFGSIMLYSLANIANAFVARRVDVRGAALRRRGGAGGRAGRGHHAGQRIIAEGDAASAPPSWPAWAMGAVVAVLVGEPSTGGPPTSSAAGWAWRCWCCASA